MAEKKIPLRMCLGCGEMKPKKELIRIVYDGERIMIDSTGKKNGRGAYVCGDPACIGLLAKKRGLDRSFKMKISDEVYKGILEEYNKTAWISFSE